MTAASVDPRAERIRHLTRTIGSAAAELAGLTAPRAADSPAVDPEDWLALRACARAMYAERRCRRQLLDQDLFGEPAWDMLLDLYVAGLSEERRTVTGVCASSEVPTTTGLRWISILETRGLVRRFPDVRDRRCYHIELSETGREIMCRYTLGVIRKRSAYHQMQDLKAPSADALRGTGDPS